MTHNSAKFVHAKVFNGWHLLRNEIDPNFANSKDENGMKNSHETALKDFKSFSVAQEFLNGTS